MNRIMKFGDFIRERLRRDKITQREFCRRSGLYMAKLHRILTGQQAFLSAEELDQLYHGFENETDTCVEILTRYLASQCQGRFSEYIRIRQETPEDGRAQLKETPPPYGADPVLSPEAAEAFDRLMADARSRCELENILLSLERLRAIYRRARLPKEKNCEPGV